MCLKCGRPRFDRWVGKIPWRRIWQTTPVVLSGKSHGQRSLVGYGPWGRRESDTTERLHLTPAPAEVAHSDGRKLRLRRGLSALAQCVLRCCDVSEDRGGFPGDASACQRRRLKRPGFNPWVRKIPLEEEMAAHCNILACRIPWTEKPGGLRLWGHKESDMTNTFTSLLIRTQVLLKDINEEEVI